MTSQRASICSLLTLVQNATVCSELGLHFLPEISVTAIFTKPAIEGAIADLDCQPDERIGLAETIYQKGMKTFAILIVMRREDDIVKFRNHDTLDDKLPLATNVAQRVMGEHGIRFADRYQWEFLPRIFPENMWVHHWEYHSKEVLPFVESKYVTEGGFGEIHKMKILASQQKFFPEEQNVEVQIIRKRLKSKPSTTVARETKCLRLLNQLRHPNIIKLLGSYTYREEDYFMFPYIDMDLECFFKTKDRFGEFQYNFTFYSALRGLSSALSKTHRLHLNQKDHQVSFEAIGYHHDLRPKNVLVSKDTFILADFGLSDLKPADAQSQTPAKATSGDYLAPECGIEDTEREDVGRSIDVWAFGCLLADVATYMCKGNAGIQDFACKRCIPGRLSRWKTTVFYQADGHVKDEVSAWLKALPQDNSGRDLILPLVELSLTTLTRDPDHRPTITKVCETLTLLSLQAHSFAVQSQFAAYLEVHKRPTAYNLWFLQERFHAWSRTLCLEKDNPPADLSVLLDKYDQFIVNMVDLFHQLQGKVASSPIDPMDGSVFETGVDQLVENLWDLLPADAQGIAEA